MSLKTWIASFSVLLAASLLIFYSRPIAEFFVGQFIKPIRPTDTRSLATLTAVSGAVSQRKAGQPDFSLVRGTTELRHLDQIKIERDGHASAIFTSGWEMSFAPSTALTFEMFQPGATSSPVFLTFARGDYTVTKKGAPGELFIMKDGRLFSPESKPKPQERTIEFAPLEVSPLPESAQPTTPEPPLPDTANPKGDTRVTGLPSARTPGKMPEKLPTSDGETLSNSYIANVIEGHADSLRRCQQNSMRDNSSSEGALLLSLTIQPTGRIEKVRMLQDRIQNPRLSSCVISVFERLQFKTFAGLPITMTYPLEFK